MSATSLTSAQQKVLALIVAGSTATAAAAAVGIHRNTVSNWMRCLPGFSEAFAQARFDQALQWDEQTTKLVSAALHTVGGIMSAPDSPDAVRLKAALAILDRASALLSPLAASPQPPSGEQLAQVHNPAQSQLGQAPPVTPLRLS